MADNIQVVVRTRPFLEREERAGAETVWRTEGGNTIKSTAAASKQCAFIFDHVFPPESSTADVYEKIDPIIVSAMNGFNGTIFAYGQTASGKTHTMMGSPREPGIIPRAAKQIYEHIENMWNREFLIRVSYMELYNENVVDLLGDGRSHLDIREDVAGKVFVDKLKENVTKSPEEILSLIDGGEKKRHFGATNMNERSSRSHTIFRVIVESREIEDTENNHIIVSALNLVDLAGSEKAKQTGAAGTRLQEGGYINKSLSALSKVISQLSDPAAANRHVSYRDSKLTRILQNSLGGNSKTAIICNCTPACYDETLSTLRFATSAKRILNKPVKNEVLSNEAMIIQYKVKIGRLQKELDKMKSTDVGCVQEMNQELQQRLQEEEKKRADQQEQIQRLTQLICVSSHLRPTGTTPDFKARSKRRETWCPGGLRVKGSKMLSLSPIADLESAETFSPPFRRISHDFPPRRSAPHREAANTAAALIEEEPAAAAVRGSEAEAEELRAKLASTLEELSEAREILAEREKQYSQLDTSHLNLRCEYDELQEFAGIERELRDASLAEAFTPKTANSKEEVKKLQAILERDRQDSAYVIQDLQKELALARDHSALLQAEMDEQKKATRKLENERGDFDILMEIEKDKFKRRESELKEQLERAYTEGGQSVSSPQPLPSDGAQVQALQLQLDSLRSELDEKNSLAESFGAKNMDLMDQIQRLEMAHGESGEAASAEAEILHAQIQELKQHISRLEAAHDERGEGASAELEASQAQIQELNHHIAKMNTELLETREDLSAQTSQDARVQQLTEQVQSLQAQLALAAECGGGAQPMSLADELAELTTGLTDMFPRKSLARSPSQASELEEDALSELQQDLAFTNSQLKQQATQLKEELSRMQEERDRTQDELVRVQGEQGSIQVERDRVQDELSRVQDELGRMQGERDRVQDELSRVQEERGSVQDERDRIQVELSRMQGERGHVDERNPLQDELSRVQDELGRVQDELSDAEHLLTRKECELAEAEEHDKKMKIQHEDKVAELDGEIQELLRAFGEIRQKDEEHQSEKKEMQVLIDSCMQEKDKYCKQAAQLQEIVDGFTQERAELVDEKARLQRIIDSSNLEKDRLTNENTHLQELLSNNTEKDVTLEQKVIELQDTISRLQESINRSSSETEKLANENTLLQELLSNNTEKDVNLELKAKQLQETIVRLQETLAQDTKDHEEMVTRNKELQERLDGQSEAEGQLKEQLAQLQGLIDGYSDSERRLRSEEEELRQQIDRSREREDELAGHNRQLQDTIAVFERETSEFKNQVTQLQDVIITLNTKMDDYQARNRQIENEVEALKQSGVDKENEMFKRISALSNDLDDIQSENVDLVAKEQERSKTICKHEEELQTNFEQIAKLREEVQEQCKKLAEAEGERDVVRGELSRMRGMAEGQHAQDAEVSELSEQNQQQANIITALRRDNSELAESLAKAEEKVESCEAMIARGRQMLQRLQEDYDEVADQCSELETLNQELEKERDELSSGTEEVHEKYKQQMEDMSDTYRVEMEALDSRVQSLKDESNQYQQHVLSLQTELESSQAELESVRSERGSLQAEVEELRSSGASSSAELDTWRQQAHTASGELARAQEEAARRAAEVVELQRTCETYTEDIRRLQTAYSHQRADAARVRQLVAEGSLASQLLASDAEAKYQDMLKTLRDDYEARYTELLAYKERAEAESGEDVTAEEYARMRTRVHVISQQSADIAENIDKLQKSMTALEKDKEQVEREKAAEEARLMACCDEADAELEEMRRQRNTLQQKVNEMVASQKTGADKDAITSLQADIQQLKQQNQQLKEAVKKVESAKEEIIRESEAEEARLMACCDEADAELEEMTRRRYDLQLELEKLRKADNPQVKELQAEKTRLEKRSGEQAIKLEVLKRDLLTAGDPFRQKIRLLERELSMSKERESQLRNEVRKRCNNQADDSILQPRACNISGPAGVNAEIMKCQLEAERRRHDKETKWIRAQNDDLKKTEKTLRESVQELRRQVQEKESTIKEFKDMYRKKLTSDERHTLRDIANSPAPSLKLGRVPTARRENVPPATPRRDKPKGNGKLWGAFDLTFSPSLNRTVRDEDYRICTPPDPSADVQCPQQ